MNTLPTIDEILKIIPPKCFERSLLKSLGYWLLDILIYIGLLMWFPLIHASYFGRFCYTVIQGTQMWILFIMGHECTHDSFSEYPLVNHFIGELTHGALLVPFWPWKITHTAHHTYHQHFDKDRSHPWWPVGTRQTESTFYRLFRLSGAAVFFSWPAYLYGGYLDGTHILPLSKAFAGNIVTILKCLGSTITVTGFTGLYWFWLCNSNGSQFLNKIVAPWTVFSFWLYTITYLQHHQNNGKTIVYTNNTWSYIKGALQTIDRRLGFGLDTLFHHITDCHITHHLFPKIPHYNLKTATGTIYKYMAEKGVSIHGPVDTNPFRIFKESVLYNSYVSNIMGAIN